jgi:hypothetical protein
MFVKRVLLGVKLGVGVNIKRRHPLWTILVEIVGQLDKTLDLGFVGCVDFLDGYHKYS